MELSTLLSQCLTYPSGDNCQPFRFHILGPREFEIHHDENVARHRLNFSNHGSLLSLGTLLETISLTAQTVGLQVRVETFFPEAIRTRGLQLWAKVNLRDSPSPMTATDRELHGAIAVRTVKRGRYEAEPLPSDVTRWLVFEAANNPHLAFAFHNQLSPSLTMALLSLEEETWKDFDLAKDLLKWIRFSKNAAERSRDGMTWRSLGLPTFQKPFIKLFSVFPTLYKVSAKLGATAGNRKLLADHIEHSGGFGWLALDSAEHNRIIAAGRTYFRMWLYLVSRGYAFQPLSLATLPAFEHHFHGLPENWPKTLHAHYPKLTELIRRDSKMDPNWVPLWGFRTGKAEALPLNARCLRKSLDDVSL